MPNPFVIMTGASGVGKTTIARAMRRLHPAVSVFLDEELAQPPEAFITSIGPTEGPGGPFQRGFALYSLPQLAAARTDNRPVLLDCQCRIAFLQEAIRGARLTDTRIILAECDDATQEGRLHGRGSPELAHEHMRNWRRYLHREAVEAGLDILDTGSLSVNESIGRLLAYLQV